VRCAPSEAISPAYTPGMVALARDGRKWRIGTDDDIAWITSGTTRSRTINAAIPAVFEAYATLVLPDTISEQEPQDRALLALLTAESGSQPWWLGYLDTGTDDVVFADAPKVSLYADWSYVLVEAGPKEAGRWRQGGEWSLWPGPLPNLMFPADHSWLASLLWDDDWRCIGGPASLIEAVLGHPDFEARQVVLGADATPPGHQSY
jgi:hypothetical protein